jgi:alpha-amylase
MKPKMLLQFFLFLAINLLLYPLTLFAQAGLDDDRVMLQGFYWESYRHGSPERFPALGEKKWYEIVKAKAEEIHKGRFDLLWLPPPSFAGEYSAGYNPKEYFNLNNSYGSLQQHRAMLETLLQNGVEPVADIVINHRDGSSGWADFKNPDWDTRAITQNDEAFTNPKSVDFFNTPMELRGKAEEQPSEYTQHKGTTYGYDSFRDIDHTNSQVRQDIIRYLLQLKSIGYRGWRYDMVHGYHARWIGTYNRASHPTFSVGEYDWDKHAEKRGWVWHSATTPNDFQTTSSVFDFSSQFTLKDNKGHYLALYGPFGTGIGLVGDTTDGYAWRNRAVTFLENHDTGYRTDESGNPQLHHERDSFLNDWQVEQGYAYILTHPGVPTIYWKHYFDWGNELCEKIKALINARKVADVHSGSRFYPQQNARERGIYAAYVEGRKGALYVRIGGSDQEWIPADSNYKDYREYAWGSGWKVWVGVPSNPGVQQASLKGGLPIPQYREAKEIAVEDKLVN